MELVWSTSRGGNFVRSIFTFVLAVLMTVLLWATALSQPVNAAPGPATWKGDSLIYNGQQYFQIDSSETTEGLNRQTDGTYYLSVETVNTSPLERKAHVIYFAPGNSPPDSTSAEYTIYDYSADEVFSNAQDQPDITVTKDGSESSFSSCSVDGIGWIICPVTVFLADSMDNIFSFVAQFVVVEPVLVNDPESPLFQAWNIMRSIANVAFIIAFMVIIFSQVTSVGISNYGIKKLLPRLVVAAVLVNISFYITAIGVDISNIAGYSLQNLLIDIRQSTFNITNETWSADTNQWAAVTGFILSGGAVAAGFAGIAAASGGSVAAALYLLVPILIGVLLTALFVLLVLAARQAIIVILIVISPLAFVANLLPNTEKWFTRWKDLFFSMLFFFPAFSLIFGGSQLAGGIIIQNANNILMMLFGMAVQVAPLVITPLIIKLSGGILGRIAGIINDPRRGAMDRAKNWSKQRSDLHRQKSLADMSRGGRINPFRRTAQWFDDNQRSMKERTADYEQRSENRYLGTERHAQFNEQKHDTATDRKIIEGRLERNLNAKMATDARSFDHQLEAANMAESVEITKTNLTQRLTEAKAGYTPPLNRPSGHTAALIAEAQELAKSSAAHKDGARAANDEVQAMIARSFNVPEPAAGENRDEYIASQALLNIAGGVQGARGIDRARANAVATLSKIDRDAIDNSKVLMQFEANQKKMAVKDYAGTFVITPKAAGSTTISDQQFEAALEIQAAEGQTLTFEEMRSNLNVDQSIVDRVIANNIGTFKAKGGFHLQAKPGLSLQRYLEDFRDNKETVGIGEKPRAELADEAAVTELFKRDMMRQRVETLSNVTAASLGGVKFGTYYDMAKIVRDDNGNVTGNKFDEMLAVMDENNPNDRSVLKTIHGMVQNALSDSSILGTINDRIEPTENIDERLSRMFGKETVKERIAREEAEARANGTPPPSGNPPSASL